MYESRAGDEQRRVTIRWLEMLSWVVTFDEFAASSAPRLRAALVATYGVDTGVDAAADALAYGWEHWERVGKMGNAAGYLYRVGQTSARRSRRSEIRLPMPPPLELPEFDPRLVPALKTLTESQRVVVMLVHGHGWTQVDVAEVLDISHATVRTHLARGLARLQLLLEDREHVE
jgi:DNA-directed RNA polymerase specialized sigma24 family protein